MKRSRFSASGVRIALLLAAFLGLALCYSAVVPLGEGPDEPGHAAYVFFLAREGRLPVQRADPHQSDVAGEGHQPPLAYALAAPLVAWLPPEQRQIDLPGNPRFTWAGGAELNAVAHGSREHWPWRGAVLAWHLARLVSVGLGAATVVWTYLAARALDQRFALGAGRLVPERAQPPTAHRASPVPWVAAALVAFNPQFLFVSALITNDALLAALGAALLWLVARGSRGGRRSAHAMALGALLGLALLTKQSALLLAPVALLGVWGREQRADGGGQGADRRRRAILSRCLIVLGTAALICGWWYARNWRLYGDPLGLAVFRAEFATQPFEPGRPAAWRDALAQLHDSFWARFGWMNVAAPAWATALFAVIELAGLLGLLAQARAWWRGGGRWPAPVWLALAGLPALALAWVVAFALTAGLVAWQGRLLFPALPAVAVLLARGLAWWGGGGQRAHRAGLLVVVPCALLSVALWMPLGVIRPAYPPQTLAEAAAQRWGGAPLYGRFGKAGERGAELRAWRVAGEPRPGGALELTLLWHALARQNRDWVVFIHLVDARGQIVAEDNRQPRDGAFPMTQWVLGDWVEDRHPLHLPDDLAAGTYSVLVGLYDPRTDERPGVYGRDERLLGDHLDAGRIIVSENDGR